ncbi:MAG: hypothetical protein RLZZ380_945 [Actinomycetota bacterium]|jgi:hypothetical protein
MTDVTPTRPTKIGRALFSSALKNFNKDRFVLLFPVLALIANVIVFGTLGSAVFLTETFWVSDNELRPLGAFAFAVAIGVIVSFTHVLFQACVMCAANQRYSGFEPTFASSFKEASEKIGPLSLFSLVEATVGMILRAIRDNLKGVGNFLSFIGGLAWAVASYFAIPSILFEGLGPIAAVRRSADIIKTTWGSALRVNVVAGVLFVFAWILAIGGVVGGMFLAIGDPYNYQPIAGFTVIGISLVFAFALALVQGSVMSYACVALYRYATGKPMPEFDANLMAAAFKLKREKTIRLV